MWVKDTYIKIVKNKTAYLAVRKAVQARQGRQIVKDAVTYHCDRLHGINKASERANSYDEYLELVDKLIRRFNRRTWAEKAFDRIMLDDIALDSLNRNLLQDVGLSTMSNIISAHLSRLGLADCPSAVASRALDGLIINELEYIKEEPKVDKVQELYDKFTATEKDCITLREVFWDCNSLKEFEKQVLNRAKIKYATILARNAEDSKLVSMLRQYCIELPEIHHKPNLNKEDLPYDAMDLLMNNHRARVNLMGKVRSKRKGRITTDSLHNAILNHLQNLGYNAKEGEIFKLMDMLEGATPDRKPHPKLGHSGTSTGRMGSALPDLITGDFADLELRTAAHVNKQLQDTMLNGTKWSNKQKAILEDKATASSLLKSLVNDKLAYSRLEGAFNNGGDADNCLIDTLWKELSNIGVHFTNGTEFHQLILALKEYIRNDIYIMPTRTVTLPELGQMFPVDLTQLNNPPQEESKMKHIGKINVVTYIDGQDITDLSDDAIFIKIKTLEDQVAELGEIKVKSKKLDAKVKELDEAIQGLVKLVDAR